VRDSGLAAVFDGRRFVFNESAWTAVNVFNMLRRYGLSYFRLRAAPRAMLHHYLRLYDLQVCGQHHPPCDFQVCGERRCDRERKGK